MTTEVLFIVICGVGVVFALIIVNMLVDRIDHIVKVNGLKDREGK